ncbi:MAG: hypothetical protein FWH44_05285, partial [Methanomassiliicoccaceae archaeon]|nr:hypothetical protein [Methanomassiliicoccaceae archaeon]
VAAAGLMAVSVIDTGGSDGNGAADEYLVIYEDDSIRVEYLGGNTYRFTAHGPQDADGDLPAAEMPLEANYMDDISPEDTDDTIVERIVGWYIAGDLYYGTVVIHTFSERELNGGNLIRDADMAVLGDIGDDAAEDDAEGDAEADAEEDDDGVSIYFSHTFYMYGYVLHIGTNTVEKLDLLQLLQ